MHYKQNIKLLFKNKLKFYNHGMCVVQLVIKKIITYFQIMLIYYVPFVNFKLIKS